MPPGSIVRSALEGLPHNGPPYPFDHTSILSTLRRLFGLGGPLTARDEVAPDLIGELSLDEPQNDGPASIAAPQYDPSPEAVAAAANAPLNSMQKSLCNAATHLPTASAMAAAHIEALAAKSLNPPGPTFHTAGEAAVFARGRTDAFLKS